MPRFMITGAAGQDGRIAARILHNQGHQVVGLVKNEASARGIRNSEDFTSVAVSDVTNGLELMKSFQLYCPDFVIHFAGSSSVAESWEKPSAAITSNVVGTLNLLEAVRHASPAARVVVAISSEMYPRSKIGIYSDTPTNPSSPYGVAKAASLDFLRLYRKVYGLNCYGSILFNHESPLRSQEFVTKKIAVQVAALKFGKQKQINLANPHVSKDFSWAPDLVRGVISQVMLGSEDMIFGSGQSTSISSLVDFAISSQGLDNYILSSENSTARPNDTSHPFAATPINLASWDREPKNPSEWMGLMVDSEVTQKPDVLWFVDA